jgi:deoxyribonuclease-4
MHITTKTKKHIRSTRYQHRTSKRSSSIPKFRIGAHVSIGKGFPNAIRLLLNLGAHSGQIFAGSNRSASLKTKSKPTPEDIAETRNLIVSNDIFLVIHAIYLINFCAKPASSPAISYAHENVIHDMNIAAQIGAKAVVIHTGFSLKLDKSIAIENMISNIVHILKHSRHIPSVKLLLETSAGPGSQVGYTIEEFAQIFNGVYKNSGLDATDKRRFGVCLDTAHIFVAGYDIRTVKGWISYMDNFDAEIGLRHIGLIHLNDSLWGLGKRHDVHRGIRHGTIFGLDSKEAKKVLKAIKIFSINGKVPVVLETHGAGDEHDLEPYCEELELLNSL